MELRQVAVVAKSLDPVRNQIFDLLGLASDYEDPGLIEFGLRNSVMAIGNTFLEIVSPVREQTTAGRLLARRGGDGGYMVLAQVDEIGPVSERLESLGMRKVWEIDREEVTAFHVHPKDIGAAIVSFDEMRPSSAWVWAGPGWQNRRSENVSRISGVDIQAMDPEEIASRWSKAFGCPYVLEQDLFTIKLREGEVRVLEAKDGRGDGVAGIQFDVTNKAGVESAVEKHGLRMVDGTVEVCGTNFRFMAD